MPDGPILDTTLCPSYSSLPHSGYGSLGTYGSPEEGNYGIAGGDRAESTVTRGMIATARLTLDVGGGGMAEPYTV